MYRFCDIVHNKLTGESVVRRRSGPAAHRPLVSYGFRAQKEFPPTLRRSRAAYVIAKLNTIKGILNRYRINVICFARTLSHNLVQRPVGSGKSAGRMTEFLRTLSRLERKN